MKLTLEQKLIEAAKLDGWTYHEPTSETGDAELFTHALYRPLRKCPSYDSSYDAIIQLIQKQPLEVRQQLTINGSGEIGKLSFMSTASQLFDALLSVKEFEV